MSHVLSPASQRFNAIIFNLASVVALMVAPLFWLLSSVMPVPAVMKAVVVVVPVMLWIGASIFVYAAVAHHPNETVRHFNKWAGYRFYGATGAMVVFGQPIYDMVEGSNGILAIWGAIAIIVVPLALWDIFRAFRHPWAEMTVAKEDGHE